MDPLSISASVLTVIAATITTVKTLNETVGRYKGRDKTLARLQDGLNDLISILTSLEEVAGDDSPILALLKGPVSRCAQVSHEFKNAMNVFSASSKTSLKDWAKMEFMRGDISEFIDTLADYKGTIAIGLGIITMHKTTVTQKVVGEYSEMVKDTAYNLEIRLQRIDEKLTNLTTQYSPLPEQSSIDLQDEKAVTTECLQICESASLYIQSLQDKQPTLQKEAPQQGAGHLLHQFEAQLLTQQTLNENRNRLLETISRLRERFETVAASDGADYERESSRLKEEIDFSKQCLEVCKEASSQVSSQKIHIIGEVIADEDCDQLVVTTLADLFNVRTVRAKERSIQLVGSMTDETLREVSKGRYGSRFGSLVDAQPDFVAVPPGSPQPDPSALYSYPNRPKDHLSPAEGNYSKPSSNEMRKRKVEVEEKTK